MFNRFACQFFQAASAKKSFRFRFVVQVILVLCLIVSKYCFADKAVRIVTLVCLVSQTRNKTTWKWSQSAMRNILWAHTADIEVIEMDGRSPADLLPKHDVTPAE